MPTENRPTTEIDVTASTQSETTETSKRMAERQKKAKSRRITSWILGLLALAMLGGLGYQGYKFYRDKQKPVPLAQTAKAEKPAYQANSGSLEQSPAILTMQQTLQAQQEKLQSLEQQQQGLQAIMGSATNINNENWRLAEALYLSRLAVERIQTLKDVKTAIFQLEAADARLASIQDPQLSSVRKLLVDNLLLLKAVETPDREGLWLRLGAVSEQVDNLKVRMLNEPVKTTEAPTVSGWRGFFVKIGGKLKNLIQVRSPEENTKMPNMMARITTEAEGTRLKQALILVLEEARVAVVSREAWVYTASLKTATQWLEQYFVADKIQQNLLSEIDFLQHQTINPALPDISPIVSAINTAIAQRSGRV